MRLQIQHETIVSTQGESDLNWMETHVNIQRRLYDDQFSLARTPTALEQMHQTFIQTYNTTAHQGLLKDRRLPPIPVEVLGAAQGRLYPADELTRHFAQAVFLRTTNRYGCVTWHRSHFSAEAGLPRTPVWLWGAGDHLRAPFDHVVLADDPCRDEGRDRRVTEGREGVFHATRFASPQGTLIPLTPEHSGVVHRARASRPRVARASPTRQLWLFEVAPTG